MHHGVTFFSDVTKLQVVEVRWCSADNLLQYYSEAVDITLRRAFSR